MVSVANATIMTPITLWLSAIHVLNYIYRRTNKKYILLYIYIYISIISLSPFLHSSIHYIPKFWSAMWFDSFVLHLSSDQSYAVWNHKTFVQYAYINVLAYQYKFAAKPIYALVCVQACSSFSCFMQIRNPQIC